ncbi:MAG TPA: hypothetical protein VM283_03285, partial [Armatimonadota bacterium]|nr:hypothetical protein [Armatimonadota bacterium]
MRAVWLWQRRSNRRRRIAMDITRRLGVGLNSFMLLPPFPYHSRVSLSSFETVAVRRCRCRCLAVGEAGPRAGLCRCRGTTALSGETPDLR